MERRRFLTSVGTSLLVAGLPLNALASSANAEPDLSFVHPELRSAAKAISQANISFNADLLAKMRKGQGAAEFSSLVTAQSTGKGPAILEPRVPVPGAPDVRVYLINSDATRARPAIVHVHGGGFILGSAKDELGRLGVIATQLDCVIATVDYRLAPETRFSGSVEDNYSALRWVYRNADKLGVDRRRIALMGESAGGGHAALLALAARDRGEVPLCFQALVYPMLDDRTGSTRAPGKNIGTLAWTAASNQFAWQSFLGRKPGGHDVPAAAVPARAADLTGLPPTFIEVGGIDLFVEEDIDFARRLVTAGVPTELLVVPGAFHGFDVFASQTHIAKRFIDAKVEALRQAFLA